MSTIINATTTNGVVIQPDNSGSLVLQTNSGTTALTIDTSQNVAFAKGFTVGATAAPAFSAYASASTSLVNNTDTKILFATEEFDTNNNFASSRFTPTVAGYYQINAAFYIVPTGGGLYIAGYKNGASYKLGSLTNSIISVGGISVVAFTVYLNGSTDYVEIFGWQNSGTATNTQTGINLTYFNGCLVRSA